MDEAAKRGLACLSLWVEVEQLVWGLRNDEMSDFVEICFCCPCCCTALNLCKATTRDVRKRFTPSGFTATIDHEKCVGCKRCLKTVYPQDALSFRESGGVVCVNQETCFGCGYCKPACEAGAISIRKTMPMRESMHEYFLKEHRLDLAVDGYPGAGSWAARYYPLTLVMHDQADGVRDKIGRYEESLVRAVLPKAARLATLPCASCEIGI